MTGKKREKIREQERKMCKSFPSVNSHTLAMRLDTAESVSVEQQFDTFVSFVNAYTSCPIPQIPR